MKLSTIRKYSFFIVLILSVISCKKTENKTVSIDYTYFPLTLKSWIIYDVTYRKIDKASNYDSIAKYQLKEIIDTVFEDNAGKINYRIERYSRTDSIQPWSIKDVWVQGITDNIAHRTEENIKYIKMRFPVELNKTWNGNLYNSLDTKDYKITSINKAETINGIAYDSVLTVTQENRENAIEKYYSIEKYAKKLGLIQKQDIRIIKMLPAYGGTIEERIEIADLLYINIISHGNH